MRPIISGAVSAFNTLKLLPPFSINQRHHHPQIGIGGAQEAARFSGKSALSISTSAPRLPGSRARQRTLCGIPNRSRAAPLSGSSGIASAMVWPIKRQGTLNLSSKRFSERQKGPAPDPVDLPILKTRVFCRQAQTGRADVVNGFDALLFQISFEGDIKVRASMPTKTSGRSSPKRRVKSARIWSKRRRRPSTCNNAHHRQLFHFIPGFAPFRLALAAPPRRQSAHSGSVL